MLVTVVCDLLVASEQLLCTIRECTSQAAVTGVCFALLTVNSISGWMDRTESRLYQLMHRPAAGKEGAE